MMLSTSHHTASSCQSHSILRVTTPIARPGIPLLLKPTAPVSAGNRQKRQVFGAAVANAVATVVDTGSSQGFGVYMQEAPLCSLKEGESKHVISIFVADEPGLINRVAGVFGRRGANIESLAVGLTVDKALFTIVVTGTESTVANLVKQISKMVKVKYVEDITETERVEREMMLLKVRVQAGAERTEVLQLAQIFRAKVNDVSDETLTLCVTGDVGKLAAMKKTMSKFGILEIARTGRISLQRGERLNSQPEVVEVQHKKSSGVSASAATAASDKLGVYGSSDEAQAGVWEVQNMLDPVYTTNPDEFKAHTLSIEVSDVPGVLNQVTGVFARRGYNIQSLAVGPCERPNMSRICMVVPGSEESIQKLFKQLSKLVYVQTMVDLTSTPFVNRELMLVKVKCTASQRGQLRHLEQIFRANILDVSPSTAVIEIIGKEDKLKALTDLLSPYGILEIARTGRVALPRESGVDSFLLERMVTTKVF